jgi:hypothetical protein
MSDASVIGKWNLRMEFQGREVKAMLEIDGGQDALTGMIETPIGSSDIQACLYSSNRLTFSANLSFMGSAVSLDVDCQMEDGMLKGKAVAKGLPISIPFVGVRA